MKEKAVLSTKKTLIGTNKYYMYIKEKPLIHCTKETLIGTDLWEISKL